VSILRFARGPLKLIGFLSRAEEASGPLTTVDITTFEPDDQLELPFDDSNKYVLIPLSVKSL
jgi:hypothetical protein